MRRKLLGFFSALALLGAGPALAQSAGQDRPASEAAQPPSQDQDQGSESINVGPMDRGSQETPSDEGLNKAPGSSAGGYGSGSPYAAPPSTQGTGGAGSAGSQEGQGSADVTVEEGTGGSGQQQAGALGQGSGGAGQQELSGTVVKAGRDELYVRSSDGAIVEFDVDKNTRFSDPSIKSAKDLKEGQQVRTSFTTKKTDNVATRIELSGSGGSGQSGSEHQSR